MHETLALHNTLQGALDDGAHPALVCIRVTASRGSAPRHVGTLMLVGAHSTVGTIGGGHLEHIAIAKARKGLAAQQGLPFEQTYPLGAALGQCCGGAMTLRFEAVNDANVHTLLADLATRIAAYKTLFLFGAGHVAQALVPLLSALPLRIVWGDSRDAINAEQHPFSADSTFLSAATSGENVIGTARSYPLFSTVSTVISDTLDAELSAARTGDLALIMTHSHALDEQLTQAALNTPQLAYIGLIGSATKRRLFEQRLAQRGFVASDFARLTCPIGVPAAPPQVESLTASHTVSPHSKLPAVIAVQVAAQLVGFL
jgi:xanthine dehydrogenase accessory factor